MMNLQFDICSYGAVGDGVTDNTKAIQAALDAAAKCCGVVTVPPGNYRCGMLHMDSGVSLEGHAAWSFREDGASIFTLNNASVPCLLDITGAFGCSVRGMCFNGQNLGENIHGVNLSWDKFNGGGKEDSPTFDNCRIGCFTGDGLHLEHVWCFSVRHCMLHRNGGAGVYINGWDGFILDNWLTGNCRGGLTGGEYCCSVTATGNRIEWNRLAGVYMPRGNCCNFTGNYIDRSWGPAFVFGCQNGNVDSISVTGNMIYRSGKPLERPFASPYDSSHIRLQNCENVVISGNSFRIGRDDNGCGVWSPDAVMVVEDCHDCCISNNVWNNGARREGLIMVGENPNVLIDGNVGQIMPQNYAD